MLHKQLEAAALPLSYRPKAMSKWNFWGYINCYKGGCRVKPRGSGLGLGEKKPTRAKNSPSKPLLLLVWAPHRGLCPNAHRTSVTDTPILTEAPPPSSPRTDLTTARHCHLIKVQFPQPPQRRVPPSAAVYASTIRNSLVSEHDVMGATHRTMDCWQQIVIRSSDSERRRSGLPPTRLTKTRGSRMVWSTSVFHAIISFLQSMMTYLTAAG